MKTSIFVTLLKNVEFLKTNFVTSNHKLFHLFCVTLFFINYFFVFFRTLKTPLSRTWIQFAIRLLHRVQYTYDSRTEWRWPAG